MALLNPTFLGTAPLPFLTTPAHRNTTCSLAQAALGLNSHTPAKGMALFTRQTANTRPAGTASRQSTRSSATSWPPLPWTVTSLSWVSVYSYTSEFNFPSYWELLSVKHGDVFFTPEPLLQAPRPPTARPKARLHGASHCRFPLLSRPTGWTPRPP